MAEEIEKIEAIGKLSKGMKAAPASVAEEVTRVAPNKDHFEALMNQQKPVQVEAVGAATNTHAVSPVQKPSLFDEVKNLNHQVDQVARLSPKDMAMQSEKLIAQIEQVKDQLKTPNLEIKGSVQNLLRNKLTHIDDNLKVAL